MWQRIAVVLVVMLCSLGSSGCMARRMLEIQATNIHGPSPQGVVMTIFVRVDNPNDVGVRIRQVRATVTMAQRYALPAIHYDANQFVQANGSGLIAIPAIIPWVNVRPLLRETARVSQIDYMINGQVDITAFQLAGFHVDNYYMREIGRLPRAQLLAAAERHAWQ